MKLQTFALSSSALAIALVLTGCSTPPSGMSGMDHTSTPSPSSDSTAAFNNADETFVVGMIAHHEQAIEMANLLLDKDGIDERVITLALDIKEAQGPEIDTMNRWLDDWGIAADDAGMEGMDHNDGMMSDDDMAALETASGGDAARLFLQQMTQHHQGAIDMAQQELNDGENPDALELAQTIIDAQTVEIATMQDILATL